MSAREIKLEESWKSVLADEFEKPYFELLRNFVRQETLTQTIYPSGCDIFKAFELTPFHNVQVVILGQDPYHGDGQAHGLCFSVPEGVALPPSLRNIFKELNRDTGFKIPVNGNLESWARQGVLLLNTVLTVRKNQAGSHAGKGWEQFTDAVIEKVSMNRQGVVFLLWGNYARRKKILIDSAKHFIMEAAHPSPLSAHNGFWGCGHFSKTSSILAQQGKIINWEL
jgi:uracil-DNA glycosylase